ncbi:MAG TPA: homoserine O-acetyltransferase, partial [Bacteroidales bacterium]|nr:homoserine O-acetyltransferase [Bacteroidales bacterium]
MSELKIFKTGQSLTLENGDLLNDIEIGYHTFGTLNASRDNVLWICHAFTANSDATDWWKGMVGEGCVFDPDRY